MRYIPFPAYYDDAPIDLSFVYQDEKPAGKHGFLQAKGDNFVFEDGTVARFWGTNFNGGANFPAFEYSEKIAKRLAKIGVNLVRFHQLDAEWDHPNIFAFTNGKRQGDTLSLDIESMKRLDYLIYCLKNEGIYCYLDILTYRKFKSGDGVENALQLPDSAKPYHYYNPRLIELQKKFIYDLFTHVNPYTNLAYKDDPVFVLCEIVNESDFFSRNIAVEPYASEFRALYRQWLDENKIEADADRCDINTMADKNLVEFKIQLQEAYYKDFDAFMRSIGVKIPITGTNWTINSANIKAQRKTDFIDSHVYFYDWVWQENEKHCANRAISENPDYNLHILSIMRAYGKPFFVSEWDMPWPNEYRAESPLYYAAVGALQNWSGFAIHTYAYSARLQYMNILGKEVSSSMIGNVPYREGIFSTWNDPAKFGLFYHAALITRRADVDPSVNKIQVKLNTDTDLALPQLEHISEISSFATSFEEGVDPKTVTAADHGKKELLSDNGQLYRNWDKKYGYIKSPRTKCAYGFLGENPPIDLDGITIKTETDFAVVAFSSLNDNPIDQSDNILLTTVGRAKNTGAEFEGSKMTNYGTAPILIEVIQTEIEMKTKRNDLVVRSVNAEGFYIGKIPSSYENGVLKFTLGITAPSMYYLIQAE